jgi:hypothetical protein
MEREGGDSTIFPLLVNACCDYIVLNSFMVLIL